MANYAYVENNEVNNLYDLLPPNWRNISNFYVLTDEELKVHGWYKVVIDTPNYNQETQTLGNPTYHFENDIVYERPTVIDLPVIIPVEAPVISEEQLEMIRQYEISTKWSDVRTNRDRLMAEFEWRYTRYNRQIRMNIQPTDNIAILDTYMQALADITNTEDPFAIQWPIYTG